MPISGTTETISPILETREDRSIYTSIIYGETRTLGAAQTDPVWRIYRISISGQQHNKQYALNDSDFVHQWSNRLALFPDVPFVNEFSANFENGTNDYASVPDNASLRFANNATLSLAVWVKTTNTAAYTLFDKTVVSRGYTVEVDGTGKPIFEMRGTGGATDRIRVRADTVNLSNGNWRLLVLTKSTATAASSVKMYIDGVSVVLTVLNDTLTGDPQSTGILAVGSNSAGASRVDGFLDEAAVWNEQLTASEVTEIYNLNNGIINLSTGSGQISSGLVSWWRFGDGMTSFPIIPDAFGTNTMTLQAGFVPGNIITEVPP